MKKYFFILILAFIPLLKIQPQNYIGLHKDELMQVMKATQRNFKLNTGAVNNAYKYLKYEDMIKEKTMLFFLSEDDHCTYVRLISDYKNLNEVIKSLNEKYTKKDNYFWTYKEDGNVYCVHLEKGEWFFTVSTKKNN